MDKIELQQKIALYYSKLPPSVQVLFSSMKWLETLRIISRKYGLNDKQTETLGTETTLVLLGIIHPVEYEEVLTKELGLSTDSTDRMLVEIEESILKTIRPQLSQAFEANKSAESGEAPYVGSDLDPRFDKLPTEIKNIIKESNYQETLYNAGKEYNLNVAQMGILETAVTDLTVGSIKPDAFENFLKANLGIAPETVRKLVNELNDQIFKKIREALVRNTERKEVLERDRDTTKQEEALIFENKRDTAILNEHGIEIVPEKLEITGRQQPVINKEEILKKVEEIKIVPIQKAFVQTNTPKTETSTVSEKRVDMILSQKLAGSIKIGAAETSHSLPNLQSSSSSGKSLGGKADPYREIPE